MLMAHTPRLWLYAPNVNVGGGKVLLLALLHELRERKMELCLIIDRRMDELPMNLDANLLWCVEPTVMGRFATELRLCFHLKDKDVLLSVNSLPPLLARLGTQIVFIQNRYIIDNSQDDALGFRLRLKMLVERGWLYMLRHSVSALVVQTPSMQKQVKRRLGLDSRVLSFVGRRIKSVIHLEQEKSFDYLYVASGEPHKNHRVLIKAWIVLAKRGSCYSLCLTLDQRKDAELCAWIIEMKQLYGLDITIKGGLSYLQVQNLYSISKALIYPSRFESFGLPLLEAVYAKLPIIAADVDYVYDVIMPTAVFDPANPDAIADAVMRRADDPAELAINPLTPKDFLVKVFGGDF